MTDDPAITNELMEQVGKPVEIQHPSKEGSRVGVLAERVIVPGNSGTTDVSCWNVVDLITFPNEPEPKLIRIGTYRKLNDGLAWDIQSTITEPAVGWKRLLVKAAQETQWFRSVLESAVAELRTSNRKAIIDEFIRVDKKSDTVEFRVRHITWDCQKPRVRWHRVFCSNLPLTDDQVNQRIAAILDDKKHFQSCAECGDLNPVGWMSDECICQGCASANHGVIY